jgi:transcriptional regulator with XRE-family HTH domain
MSSASIVTTSLSHLGVAMSSTQQRVQLSDFLKSCRARTSPAAVGLIPAERRRSKGLRREDVAALAGLSATWYTWLEQGRDVHPSEQVLERLSGALGLSPAERDYLFMLAQHRPPPLAPVVVDEIRPATRRMLDALNVPALIHTRRWDVLAWNATWTTCFPDLGLRPAHDRNLLKILLTEADFNREPTEHDQIARRVLARARLDYSQSTDDPAFDQLIEELSALCPDFQRYWRSAEITSSSEGVYKQVYPQLGEIAFEHTSYSIEAAPQLRLLIFSPADVVSTRNLATLIQGRSS